MPIAPDEQASRGARRQGANDGPETQVAFAIDGRLSDEHEEAFARANLRKKLGIGPVLDVELLGVEGLLDQFNGGTV